MEPVTVLQPQIFAREQFQDGSENISFCNFATVLYIFFCCLHRIFSIGLYGDIESVTALRRLRNCRDIIIIFLYPWYLLSRGILEKN